MRVARTHLIVIGLLSLARQGDATAGPSDASLPRIDQPDTLTLAVGGGYSWLESETDGGLNGTVAALFCPWSHVLAGARISMHSQMTLGLSDQISVMDIAPLIGVGGSAGRFSASAAVGPALTLYMVQHANPFTGRGDTDTDATLGLAVDAGIGWRTGRFIDVTMRGVANVNDLGSAAGVLLGVQGTYAL
jgi:hypothetical protein